MTQAQEKAQRAKNAAGAMLYLSQNQKNDILNAMAKALREQSAPILAANIFDVQAAREKGVSDALCDRLELSVSRINQMASGLEHIAKLDDLIGEVLWMHERPNGLRIGKKRVPLGVVGIIYESRPNVTADAAGLCLKSGNAVLLRGGSDAVRSNVEIVRVLTQAGEAAGMPEGAVEILTDTSRECANEMMRLNGLIDVLIPRGGAGLIRTVVENATVPVIETGTGNCHIYVDAGADLQMAQEIVVNAKTSRPGVCNAAETLLVHKDIAKEFLPACAKALKEKNVELRGCEGTLEILQDITPATDEDYYTEFLDLILAVKIVDDVDQAIEHINKHNTKHSEAIVTENYSRAQHFLDAVDAAAVYVNASTRFTDGEEFGFGAEIGISTQKMHARGPMGLEALTSIKYVVYGDGQVRG